MLHRRFLVVIKKWAKETYLDSNAMFVEEMILSLLRSNRSQFSAILADEHLHKQREKTQAKNLLTTTMYQSGKIQFALIIHWTNGNGTIRVVIYLY